MVTKFISIVLYIILLFVFVGCGSDTNESVGTVHTTHENSNVLFVSDEHLIKVDSLNAIFMNDDSIIFTHSHERNLQWREFGIFAVSMVTNGYVVSELYSIENASMRWLSLAVGHDGYFYMPLAVSTDNEDIYKIFKFDSSATLHNPGYSTLREEEIIQEVGQPIYLNLFVENDFLIVFEPIFVGDAFNYRVTRLNM